MTHLAGMNHDPRFLRARNCATQQQAAENTKRAFENYGAGAYHAATRHGV